MAAGLGGLTPYFIPQEDPTDSATAEDNSNSENSTTSNNTSSGSGSGSGRGVEGEGGLCWRGLPEPCLAVLPPDDAIQVRHGCSRTRHVRLDRTAAATTEKAIRVGVTDSRVHYSTVVYSAEEYKK